MSKDNNHIFINIKGEEVSNYIASYGLPPKDKYIEVKGGNIDTCVNVPSRVSAMSN